MECEEYPDVLVPRPECRCRACARAREDSIPVKLRLLAHEQFHPSRLTITASNGIIHRALSMYIAGHIGLAEMQIELIAALAQEVDQQFQRLVDIEAMKPLFLSKESR